MIISLQRLSLAISGVMRANFVLGCEDFLAAFTGVNSGIVDVLKMSPHWTIARELLRTKATNFSIPGIHVWSSSQHRLFKSAHGTSFPLLLPIFLGFFPRRSCFCEMFSTELCLDVHCSCVDENRRGFILQIANEIESSTFSFEKFPFFVFPLQMF